jgi:Phenylpropionate dioxygenase and related ring-hydroxylating dioxygenases, large terminal subunit
MPTSLESGADARALTALTRRWHPVAYSTEINQQPFGTTLLGEPVVVWRDETGRPHAMRDLCIHRGTALSLGRVESSEIICAYHGWRYTADGKCSRIPQLTDSSQIPPKARVDAYHCQERYGLVWVALLSLSEQPERSLAQVPELEAGEWTVVKTGPFSWQTNASRQVENFTDFGHFPWVHPGLLGDPERPEVPPHNVRTEGDVLHYEVLRPEAPNSKEFPVFSNAEQKQPQRRSRYELHLPYTIVLRLGWGGREGMVYFFVSQPVKEDQCRGYCIIGRNYNFEQPASVLQEFERVIFSQDQRIAESQRPDKVPFDLAAELHLKFDVVAVAYRRAMKANGLG